MQANTDLRLQRVPAAAPRPEVEGAALSSALPAHCCPPLTLEAATLGQGPASSEAMSAIALKSSSCFCTAFHRAHWGRPGSNMKHTGLQRSRSSTTSAIPGGQRHIAPTRPPLAAPAAAPTAAAHTVSSSMLATRRIAGACVRACACHCRAAFGPSLRTRPQTQPPTQHAHTHTHSRAHTHNISQYTQAGWLGTPAGGGGLPAVAAAAACRSLHSCSCSTYSSVVWWLLRQLRLHRVRVGGAAACADVRALACLHSRRHSRLSLHPLHRRRAAGARHGRTQPAVYGE